MQLELTLLETINNSDKVKQRELASKLEVSLGMVNAMLKRLVEKGLIKASEINRRNIRYLVTSKGLDLLSKKSYRVFRESLNHVVLYRDLVSALVDDVRKKGYDGAMLIGPSKVDFMVEWACKRAGVDFIIDDGYEKRMALIYSETYIPDRENIESYFLQKLFLESERG